MSSRQSEFAKLGPSRSFLKSHFSTGQYNEPRCKLKNTVHFDFLSIEARVTVFVQQRVNKFDQVQISVRNGDFLASDFYQYFLTFNFLSRIAL